MSKKLEAISLYNNFVIDCKEQNNIGAVLQYLTEIASRKISMYSSEKEILENEKIVIFKSGLYHSGEKEDFTVIKGNSFLKDFVFSEIKFNIEIDEALSILKPIVEKNREKMNYCFDNNIECLNGVSREYYKGVSNFYYEVCNAFGDSAIKNNTKILKEKIYKQVNTN